MYIKLLLIIILAIPHVSSASHEMQAGSEICGVVENNRNVSNICQIVSEKSPADSKRHIHKICENFLSDFNRDPAQARVNCETGVNTAVNKKDYLKSIISTPGMAPGFIDQQETVSSELNDCSTKFLNPQDCYPSLIGMESFSEGFEKMLKKLRPIEQSMLVKKSDYSDETCACLRSMITDPETYRAEISMRKPQIEKEMQKAVGKKLINEFAANLEDVNFFKVNYHPTDSRNGTNMLGSLEDIESFQCNSPEEYSQKIKSACAENNIPPEEIKNRLNNLLGGFGDFKEASSLKDKFAMLQEDILNVDINTTKSSTKTKTQNFSRGAYDKYRFGRYKSHLEVNFVNEITESLLDQKEIAEQFSKDIEKGHSPARIIFGLLKDKGNEKVVKVLQKAITKNKSTTFYNELNKALKNPDPTALREFIDNTTDFALDMHPGLKALYKDTTLFTEARKISKDSRKDSMLDVLEKNPALLKSHFKDRCNQIIENFTEAACVKSGEIMSLANRGDLNRLIDSPDVKISISPKAKDLMLCEINQNPNEDSIFKRTTFNTWDRLKLSNYWERKSSGGESNDRYSRIAKALSTGDDNIAQAFAATSGISDAFSFNNQDFNKLAISRALPEPDVKIKSSEMQNIMSGITNFSDINPNEAESRQQAIVNPTYSNSIQQQAHTQNLSPNQNKEQIDPREILREFLANDQNKSDVDKHLANIKTEDQRELIRLKEELASNKETMLKLMSELEQTKMKKLTADFERLESNYKKVAKPEAIEEEVSESINNREVTSFGPQTGGHTGQIDIPREVNSFANSGGAQTSSAGNGSGAVNRSIASESAPLLQKNAGPTESNFSFREMSNGEILIISSKIHETGALRTEDFSEEVMAFVKKNQPDVKTLKKLMSSGLILKFNVRKNGIETQQEIKVDSSKLTADAVKYLQNEITQKEFKEAQRAYSFSTLKLLLGIKAKNSVN